MSGLIGSNKFRRAPTLTGAAALCILLLSPPPAAAQSPDSSSETTAATGRPLMIVPQSVTGSASNPSFFQDRPVLSGGSDDPNRPLVGPAPSGSIVQRLGDTEASSGIITLSEAERSVAIEGVASVATVETEEVVAATFENIGLTPETPGGPLDIDMFGSSTRNDLRALLTALPTESPTPAMRALMRDVLATSTIPLRGSLQTQEGDSSILGLRVRKLSELGYGDLLETLAATFPTLLLDDDAQKGWVEGMVLLDRLTPVCARAEAQLGSAAAADPFWQEILILCALQTGDESLASLTTDILADQVGETRFVALARRILLDRNETAASAAEELAEGGEDRSAEAGPADEDAAAAGDDGERASEVVTPRPTALPPLSTPPSAATVAMHLASGTPLPSSVLRNAPPALLDTVAYADGTPARIRLQAAERSTAAGLMSPFTLGRLQSSIRMSPEALQNPIGFAERRSGADSRAVLVQGAIEASLLGAVGDGSTATDIQHFMLQQAVSERLPLPVVAALLQGLYPEPAHLPIAESAAAVSYALDDPALADGWIALIEDAFLAEQAALEAPEAAAEPGSAEAEAEAPEGGDVASGDASAVGAAEVGSAEEAPTGDDGTSTTDAAEDQVPEMETEIPDLGAALDRLWPLRHLAEADQPGRLDDMEYVAGLSGWLDELLLSSDAAGSDHAVAVTLSLLDALGHEVDATVWRRLSLEESRTEAELPAATLWWRLPRAAAAGESGVVALISVIVLGEDGVANAHPVVLAHVVKALVDVGLEDQARSLALEAVWAALPL